MARICKSKNELFVNFPRKSMRLHTLPKGNRENPDFFKLTSWMNRYVDIRTTQHTDTTDVFSVLRAQIVECVPGIRLYGGS
jgi:hypothetical protein